VIFLSRANGEQLVVDHFLRGWRSMQKKKKVEDTTIQGKIADDEMEWRG
jgi:hypothetical protein